MLHTLSPPPIDTQYPLSPEGDPFGVIPAPLDSELQRRLTRIGDQDLGAQGERPDDAVDGLYPADDLVPEVFEDRIVQVTEVDVRATRTTVEVL